MINAFTSFCDILGDLALFDALLLPRVVFGAPSCDWSLRLIRSPDFSAFAFAFAAAAFAVLDAFLPIARATALPALFAMALIVP